MLFPSVLTYKRLATQGDTIKSTYGYFDVAVVFAEKTGDRSEYGRVRCFVTSQRIESLRHSMFQPWGTRSLCLGEEPRTKYYHVVISKRH